MVRPTLRRLLSLVLLAMLLAGISLPPLAARAQSAPELPALPASLRAPIGEFGAPGLVANEVPSSQVKPSAGEVKGLWSWISGIFKGKKAVEGAKTATLASNLTKWGKRAAAVGATGVLVGSYFSETIRDTVLGVLAFVMDLLSKLFTTLQGYAFKALDLVLQIRIFADAPMVKDGWRFVRDTLNFLFLPAILAIAFATIAGIESFEARRLLPRLIMAALLVNFSLAIGGGIIAVSTAAMDALLGRQNVEQVTSKLRAVAKIEELLEDKPEESAQSVGGAPGQGSPSTTSPTSGLSPATSRVAGLSTGPPTPQVLQANTEAGGDYYAIFFRSSVAGRSGDVLLHIPGYDHISDMVRVDRNDAINALRVVGLPANSPGVPRSQLEPFLNALYPNNQDQRQAIINSADSPTARQNAVPLNDQARADQLRRSDPVGPLGPGEQRQPDTKAAWKTFIASAIKLMYIVVSSIVFVALAILFIFRVVALYILLILSPIGVVFPVLPGLGGIGRQWWNTFLRYVLFGPVALALVLLATRLQDFFRQATNTPVNSTAVGSDPILADLLQGVVVVLFLLGALYIGRQMSIYGAATALTYATKATTGSALFLSGAGPLWARTGKPFLEARAEAQKAMTQERRVGLFGRLGVLAGAPTSAAARERMHRRFEDQRVKDLAARGATLDELKQTPEGLTNRAHARYALDKELITKQEDFKTALEAVGAGTPEFNKGAKKFQERYVVEGTDFVVQQREGRAATSAEYEKTLQGLSNADAYASYTREGAKLREAIKDSKVRPTQNLARGISNAGDQEAAEEVAKVAGEIGGPTKNPVVIKELEDREMIPRGTFYFPPEFRPAR